MYTVVKVPIFYKILKKFEGCCKYRPTHWNFKKTISIAIKNKFGKHEMDIIKFRICREPEVFLSSCQSNLYVILLYHYTYYRNIRASSDWVIKSSVIRVDLQSRIELCQLFQENGFWDNFEVILTAEILCFFCFPGFSKFPVILK